MTILVSLKFVAAEGNYDHDCKYQHDENNHWHFGASKSINNYNRTGEQVSNEGTIMCPMYCCTQVS